MKMFNAAFAAILTLAAFAVPATAQHVATHSTSTWQAGVPYAGKERTGYEVPGCTDYVLEGTNVKQICDVRSPDRYFEFLPKINIDSFGGDAGAAAGE